MNYHETAIEKELNFLKQLYNDLSKDMDKLSSEMRELRNEITCYKKQTITAYESERICGNIGALATELTSCYRNKSKDEYYKEIWVFVKKELVRARLIKDVYVKYQHFTLEQYIKALEIIESIKMEHKKRKSYRGGVF